ncbi:hypothetical protein BDC45DRAFT_434027 [Circinella umbellata]|nr:hypothetical protein BDC45DRAFT_434027 [Circinella umbellata]
MTKVNATTTSKPYNADAILRATDIGNAEICLLETSSAFDKAGRPKISFDHRKAMFGLLSIAQEYYHAMYKELKKMEFIFIHAHGNSIRVWSLYSPEAGVYIMNKELKMPLPVLFEKKEEYLFDFLEGSWKLTVSIPVVLLGDCRLGTQATLTSI